MKRIFGKKIFVVVILCFLSGDLLAQKTAADQKLRSEIVGVWHASPHVGSGMNDNFQFFADGNFRFNYNQMILSKRSISFAGKWEIARGKLILIIAEKTDLVGGAKVRSEISADGYEIEGGRTVAKKISPPNKQAKVLSAIKRGEIYKMISIGGVKYWKLSDDPRAYEN
jgi:hypothetical protein